MDYIRCAEAIYPNSPKPAEFPRHDASGDVKRREITRRRRETVPTRASGQGVGGGGRLVEEDGGVLPPAQVRMVGCRFLILPSLL